MKKIIVGAVLMFLMGLSTPVDAQLKRKGGYTSVAYSELEANETYFQRMSDWFATVGKTREEKILIKSRRRVVRKMTNTQKTIARKKKEIARQKKKAMKELEERKRNVNQ